MILSLLMHVKFACCEALHMIQNYCINAKNFAFACKTFEFSCKSTVFPPKHLRSIAFSDKLCIHSQKYCVPPRNICVSLLLSFLGECKSIPVYFFPLTCFCKIKIVLCHGALMCFVCIYSCHQPCVICPCI